MGDKAHLEEHDHHCCSGGPGHTHSARGIAGPRLAASLVLTLGFVVFEIVAAARANSLALLSDAGHNFTDALALMLSWYAIHAATKPASQRRTYGYHRVSILTALVNAVTLVGIALLIAEEALTRLIRPEAVHSNIMIITAAAAIVINLAIALGLRGEAAHSVNVRSAFIHMAGDAVASLGVVVAGVVIHYTGWQILDPAISIVLAAIIGFSSWSIISETVNILLEGVPKGINLEALTSDILAISGVSAVHDLHVWSIADEMNALSCHLTVDPEVDLATSKVVSTVKQLLESRYQVDHSTIETECDGCTHDGPFHCLGASDSSMLAGSWGRDKS